MYSSLEPDARRWTLLIREAKWVGEQLRLATASRSGIKILNLGSSTEDFRKRHQPYIDRSIFQPLLNVPDVQILHCDVRSGPGIDLTADVTQKRDIRMLEKYRFDVCLMSNLLEHVTDIKAVVSHVGEILPQGSLLIATGPSRYPYHPDPIDNLFRPDRDEVKALMTEFTMRRWHVCWEWSTLVATEPSWRKRAKDIAWVSAATLRGRQPLKSVLSNFGPVSAWCAVLQRN